MGATGRTTRLISWFDFAETLSIELPNDVRLKFQQGELVANSDVLKSASPYYESLLGGDFSEGSLVDLIEGAADAQDSDAQESGTGGTGQRGRPAASPDSRSGKAPKQRKTKSSMTLDTATEISDKDGEIADSDVETDILASAKYRVPRKEGGSRQHLVDYSNAPIAFSTYHAVLVWIYSGYITFAPLLSTFTLTRKSTSRSQAVQTLAAKAPQLPFPVSPKSVYRLADLLQLEGLKKEALENLKKQLTPETVAFELFGDVASMYQDVRDVEIKYALEHWTDVKGSKALEVVEGRATAGELTAEGFSTLFALLRQGQGRSAE